MAIQTTDNQCGMPRAEGATRRSVLKGGVALGSLAGAISLGMGSASAMAKFGKAGPCAENHARMSRNLSDLLMDFDLGIDAKNIALRTTHCHDCGTRIVPVNDFVA